MTDTLDTSKMEPVNVDGRWRLVDHSRKLLTTGFIWRQALDETVRTDGFLGTDGALSLMRERYRLKWPRQA